MTVRMSQTTPQVADTDTVEETHGAPRVRVLLTAVEGADVAAALSVVKRQVYEPSPEVVIVGTETDADEEVSHAPNLEAAIGSTASSFDYLWILHADARPRPDALAALIAESERNEASLAGSKLLKAGTMDELESVGGATDVFGEPYSGLDEGEIDLQQYDVVREVAFVQSASMLVRRDLAQGLKGLDPLLPPVAAGLDFSQRTRLAGGRVITVPSSEVYHQARCGDRGTGWREQAGRLRAMVTAYSPLTLLWVLPYDFLVSIIDSLGSFLLGRWRPFVRHVMAWGWNLIHLPSTIRQRRRLKPVRAEGDEELFRFHAKGSVRLRVVGEELSGRILSLFDDDQALARGSRRVWGSPGIWGAILAAIVVFIGARSIVFTGMANSGYSFPFEPPSIALSRWFSGWNESGLGSAAAVHPGVGISGLFSFLWFGLEGAARTILTVALSMFGIVGMGRLGGRVGLRGPGRYLAGIVLIAGPGTAVLVDQGSWLTLCAAALLPWAVRASFVHPHEFGKSRLTYAGWALLAGLLAAMFSPLLALIPMIVVLVWRVLGGTRESVLLALVAALGPIGGIAYLVGDQGWLLDPSQHLGGPVADHWPALILVAAAPMVMVKGQLRPVALTGGTLSLAALAAYRFVPLGPGIEEVVLILASFGAAMLVAAGLDGFSRNGFRIVAALGSAAVLVLSLAAVGNGRLGLPRGDDNARLSFATTLAPENGPGRILHASEDRSVIPGEVRAGPGFWYRVLDGNGTTLDEVWLPEIQRGDEELQAALVEIASGAELRPGERLAGFAIDWVVVEGPAFVLDDMLVAQLDLEPLPLDPDSRVYENGSALPLAGTTNDPWAENGVGFSGESVDGPIGISMNFADGWEPNGNEVEWFIAVSGSTGSAIYRAPAFRLVTSIATIALFFGSITLILVGRRRRS